MIQFVMVENHVRFAVNLDALNRAHLMLSSELLRVASSIRREAAEAGTAMKLWNARSISGKLMRMTLLVSGTALLLAYVSFLGYDLYTLRQNLIISLGTEAGIVGANSVTSLLFDDKQAAEATLSALHNSPQIRAAIINRADGRPLARYLRDQSALPRMDDRLVSGESTRYWTKGRDILLGYRIDFQGKPLGAVYLLAETSDVARRTQRFGLISACMMIICFVIALLATSTIRHSSLIH